MPRPHEHAPGRDIASLDFQRIWLTTFVSLFLALLAFFIVLITQVVLEDIPEKRAYELVLQDMTRVVRRYVVTQGMPWLKVEDAFPKGVRLYPDSTLVRTYMLFYPGQARINPVFDNYFLETARLLTTLDVSHFDQHYARLLRPLHAKGLHVRLVVRVEGHTDTAPLGPNARFPDNVTLSVFRAHAVMARLRNLTSIPENHWAIAGYGPWHPLFENPDDPRNRRIEIFLQPQLIRQTGAGHG